MLSLHTGDADLSISTSTPTPCYGDVVTLVCHHPEVASNRVRYFTSTPLWRENGVGIIPSIGVYLQTDTSEDLTSTTLTITITVDHFRNKSFDYTCLLALAENGLPTGGVETSENVTVDPVGEWVLCRTMIVYVLYDCVQHCMKSHAINVQSCTVSRVTASFLYCVSFVCFYYNHTKYTSPTTEPRPPSTIVNIDCSVPTSIAFNWTHTPVECYKDRISYYVSWVNIDNNTESGSDVTGEHMYNITGLVANSNYTISVQTVVDGNVQSTAVSRNVTASEFN